MVYTSMKKYHGVYMCWSRIAFFFGIHHSGFSNEDSTFLILVGWWYFCFQYPSDRYTMQKPSYLGNLILMSVIWNSLGPNNNLSLQRYCHFDIPTKYQYFIGNQFLCPWVDSLVLLLMLIIGTNAFTYIPTLVCIN